jgi:hypothetical protein
MCLLPVVFFGLGTRAAAETEYVPRVAIAPISREYFDGQEGLGESFTPLVLASLSSDPRWALVERVDLADLEKEWTLVNSGGDEVVSAVTRGRLIGADWMLVFRPDLASPEHPRLRIEIVDTARAEPLATQAVALLQRPRARWFRNPPAPDMETVLVACRESLASALATRAGRVDVRVAALLSLVPEEHLDVAAANSVVELEAAIAAAFAGGPPSAGPVWRLLAPTSPEASRGEGLLRAAGFVTAGSTSSAANIADAFLWGSFSVRDGTLRLNLRIWSGQGEPLARNFEGTPVLIAASVARVLKALPTPASPIVESDRYPLAQTLVAEARALAIKHPISAETAPLVRRWLELAAFFAPADREIQELRLIASRRAPPHDAEAARLETLRLGMEYARLADLFWQKPDNRYDLRLLVASFLSVEYFVPGQKARAVRVAPVIARMPPSALAPHRRLFEWWLDYCEKPDSDSFALLAVVLPLVARFNPERMNTPPQGGFQGFLPRLLETYRNENRQRLLALVDRLPRDGSPPVLDAPLVPAPEHIPVVIEDSPAPVLGPSR